jgi:uncharacterized protein (TIGR03067 family)
MFRASTRHLSIAVLALVGIGLAVLWGTRAQSANGSMKKVDFEGSWEVVELVRGDSASKVLPSEDFTGMVDFQEDTIRFTMSSHGKVDTRRMASFSADLSLDSGSIDLTMIGGPNNGQVVMGIFELVGDELRICLPIQPPFNERPTGFKVENGTSRESFVLRRLEK